MWSPRALLPLLLAPGLASYSPLPSMQVVDASDAALVRVGGVLLERGQPFTGSVVERDSGGRLIARTGYLAGRRDGTAEGWYPNGQPAYRRGYRAGREDGLHTGWWDDGRLHFSYRYRRGLIEGVAREWLPSGRLYREYHYAAGRESGSQKMWNSDGTLRANYVVRDGRRFGLPGVKGCTGLDTAVVIP